MDMQASGRVNWLSCPNCQWRYYADERLFLVENPEAICPKCRTEFDPRTRLEPRPMVSAIAPKTAIKEQQGWVYYGRRM